MESSDSFFQELDSESLLLRHRADLLKDAREVLAENPMAKVAGLITAPDSRDAVPIRQMLEQSSGQKLPMGLLVGLVPREFVEKLLLAYVEHHVWKEEPWQAQQVLPVVVATKDGYRFGFVGLVEETESS